MQVGDLVKSTYSKSKGMITQDLGLVMDAGTGAKSRRFEVKLFSTGGICTFRSYELEVISGSR